MDSTRWAIVAVLSAVVWFVFLWASIESAVCAAVERAKRREAGSREWSPLAKILVVVVVLAVPAAAAVIAIMSS